MLFYCDPSNPIYVIGKGIFAQELGFWIKQSHDVDVHCLPAEELDSLSAGSQCVLGIQDIAHRATILASAENKSFHWVSFVHPTAWLCQYELIQSGTVVGPQCSIGYQSKIGPHCVINTCCKIGHGDILGCNVVTGPATIIGGSTCIGNNVYTGQATSIKDKINIGSNICFSMNSVVTRDVLQAGNYHGNKRILTR